MKPICAWILFACSLAAAPPNVVLIVSDDQGWNDVGFHGGEIRTPNLDRIASQGVELNRFYACPVCSPTRAGLATGRYPIRFGMQRAVCRPFLDVGVPPEEETVAEMLGRAGYAARGAVGKWHIGHSRLRYHPLRQGFTFFYGHYNGNIDYFTHMRDGELDWHRGFDSSYDEGYSTDLIADEAVRFIEEQAGGESPFFLYVPFNAPHAPLQVPAKWLDDYASIGDKDRRTYAAMVAAMDAGVGRILEALDRTGVTNDTLVWFFSDNGGPGTGDNTPLRAGKGTVYEGGVRVAAALRWPGKVRAGGKVETPLMN
ncbi:MAG: sulfatase-like hydrolase/transferase, partial [Bryobacterales bacterium]